MVAKRENERGETLLEILIAIVIIGIAMSSLFYAYALSTTGSANHQDFVIANGVLRDYAESTKSAVKTSCPGASFTTSYTLPADLVTKGFSVSSAPALAAHACPSQTSPLPIQLSVTLPNGEGTKNLDMDVRTQ
jgi:prepilin-type N-terminal cleavage/methylation domain-containing protein